MLRILLFVTLLGALGAASAGALPRSYRFSRTISRAVLESYLSRAVTAMDLCTDRGNVDDNLRMLRSIGAKFAGRTVYLWGDEGGLGWRLERAAEIARKLHAADPDMILQAGIFEVVTRQVEKVTIPRRVFQEFGLAPEERSFRYADMLFPSGRFKDHWGPDASVPDITRLETRMWFYHLASSYIDAGMEGIHFGQVALIGADDTGNERWWELLTRVRRYAAAHARRRMVLCDAHTPDGGPRHGENLLFDFHAFPLRIKEVADEPRKGVLEVGYLDSIFRRSAGGVTPSGWRCESLPYLVELDNWGSSGKGGQGGLSYWTWGYDEICWFARQPAAYRDSWLRYAWRWVREHDPNGYLQMPMSRCLADPVDGVAWYLANRRSNATPDGFGQEDAIGAIWREDG